MAKDVMADLVGLTKKTPDAVVARGSGTKKTKGPAAPKTAPVKTPAATPAAAKTATGKAPATVSRGAVEKKAAAPRRVAVPYTDDMKISLVEGARKYRTGGNVEKAVLLMKKAGTVGAYVKAMEASENPLPAVGLLRYLHKKQCVTVA
jgi:hypothetical protein